jgi:(E)-4-hydroxy-3-methylbut-2-enyl-diphosphate synthase
MVGGVAIGGGSPVSVQSMTKTPTRDARATLRQIEALVQAGCDIVRLATPTPADTAALKEIVRASPIPVVADVHFHYQRALEAVAAGVHKIRLNPGTIADRQAVRAVIQACKSAGIPIRIGVNEGSIGGAGVSPARKAQRASSRRKQADTDRAAMPASPLVKLMVKAIQSYLEIFQDAGFEDLVVSAKSHDALTCIEAYRALSRRFDYPLHLGLTHAGTVHTGLVRSVAALGALLAEGIGDTVRISLAGDPVREVQAGVELLCSLRLRPRAGVEVIACPTCGRTEADVEGLAEKVRLALADLKRHVTVAVMGCIVNGPGEAAGADVAACCGKGRAAIYRAGKHLQTVPMGRVLAALVVEARAVARG